MRNKNKEIYAKSTATILFNLQLLYKVMSPGKSASHFILSGMTPVGLFQEIP
jgi:hypothetical protein